MEISGKITAKVSPNVDSNDSAEISVASLPEFFALKVIIYVTNRTSQGKERRLLRAFQQPSFRQSGSGSAGYIKSVMNCSY